MFQRRWEQQNKYRPRPRPLTLILLTGALFTFSPLLSSSPSLQLRSSTHPAIPAYYSWYLSLPYISSLFTGCAVGKKDIWLRIDRWA
ncbi:uncharacterized protein EI90DRAFT_3045148 [Cantharellus anzutake]|uniref:uncharacterized protein n=1 Tax=Cantharellus anzutake TaxID=1750568 RepID=UPI001907049F|nr:uncharacterized protein EI90DRAFT_3045148 [Cantharellus anzutake]KAF8336282.1 hypothetical protein EI90DRAFT_3045148 [Cantharellus anzutake]